MKKLTAWAAIIAVPTAVTGYFGQNVPYPGFGKHWGFWLSIADDRLHRHCVVRLIPASRLAVIAPFRPDSQALSRAEHV